jgi:hypothetical protein
LVKRRSEATKKRERPLATPSFFTTSFLSFTTSFPALEVETTRNLDDSGADIDTGDTAELSTVDALITKEEDRCVHKVEEITTDLQADPLGNGEALEE